MTAGRGEDELPAGVVVPDDLSSLFFDDGAAPLETAGPGGGTSDCVDPPME